MPLQAFFVARTARHLPAWHEMCSETLYPHIGTGASN